MGIYWTTYLYRGALLSPTARARLPHPLPDGVELRPVARDRWIVADRVRVLGEVDGWTAAGARVHEIGRGWVDGRELAEHTDAWPDAPPGLRDAVRAASDGKMQEPGTYVCTVEWCSLGLPEECSARVTNNMRVLPVSDSCT